MSDLCIYTPSAECLGYYTQVEMADGTFKNLGDIEVGDEVLSNDFNTMKLVSRKLFIQEEIARLRSMDSSFLHKTSTKTELC